MMRFLLKLIIIAIVVVGYMAMMGPVAFECEPAACNTVLAGWLFVCVPLVYLIWRVEL